MRTAVAIGVASVAAGLGEPCDPGPWDDAAEVPLELLWPLGADLDGNLALDSGDVLEMILSLGPCPDSCPADFDASGSVDAFDLLILLAEVEQLPLLAAESPGPPST